MWRIKIDGNEVLSDDLLVDDLIAIERATKTPWSICNPWKDATVAKEFLRVALTRSGISPEDADERVQSLTLRDIKGAFDFIEDDTKASAGKGRPAPKKKGRTARSSSPGGHGDSAGPPSKPGDSD